MFAAAITNLPPIFIIMFESKLFHRWSLFQLMSAFQVLIIIAIVGYGITHLSNGVDQSFGSALILLFLPMVYYFLRQPLRLAFREEGIEFSRPFVIGRKELLAYSDIRGYSYSTTPTKYFELHTVIFYLENGKTIEVNRRNLDNYSSLLESLTHSEINYFGFEAGPEVPGKKRQYNFLKVSGNVGDQNTKQIKHELIQGSDGFNTCLAGWSAISALLICAIYFVA